MVRTLLAFWFAFVAAFGPGACCCVAVTKAIQSHLAEPSATARCPHCDPPAAPKPVPDECPCRQAMLEQATPVPLANPVQELESHPLDAMPSLATASATVEPATLAVPASPPVSTADILRPFHRLRC